MPGLSTKEHSHEIRPPCVYSIALLAMVWFRWSFCGLQDRLGQQRVGLDALTAAAGVFFADMPDHLDLRRNDVQLIVLCKEVTNDFSVTATGRTRSYLQARVDPYAFPVMRRKTTSLFDKVPDAPSPPDCHDRESN